MTRQNQVPCKEDVNKTTNTLIPFWDLGNLSYLRVGVVGQNFSNSLSYFFGNFGATALSSVLLVMSLVLFFKINFINKSMLINIVFLKI